MKYVYKLQPGIFLLLVLLPGITVCQTNTYFDHNPVWQLNRDCADPLPCIVHEDYNYYVNGDSTIGSLTYKKIYRKGTGFYSWMGPPPASPSCMGTFLNPPIFWGYLVRSSGMQIYVRSMSDTSESLLYDFDLAVGDTLPLSYNNNQSDIYVTAIDSFPTAFGFRKRYALSPNSLWATELMEGIGHNRGFLEPMNVPLECGFELTCFSLEDSSYYPTDGLICDLIVSDQQSLLVQEKVKISPSLFSVSTKLSWSERLTNGELYVYNVQGQLVRSQKNISGTSLVFKRDQLEAGVYYFEMKSGKKFSFTGKMMIAD